MTHTIGPMESRQMVYAEPCGIAYHLPFNDSDPGRLIARYHDTLLVEAAEALEAYAWHKPSCSITETVLCDCGYAAVLAKWKGTLP